MVEKFYEKKSKKCKRICSLEWYYRDELHDIGFAIQEYLEANSLRIDDNNSGLSGNKEPIFYYKNSTIKLTPLDGHHYVYMKINSSKESKCRKLFEELIKNTERILIKDLDYSKTFRIPRTSEEISIPSYKDKSCIPYYFILKIVNH